MRPKTLVFGVILLSVAAIVLALILWPRQPPNITNADPVIVVQEPQSAVVPTEPSDTTAVVPDPPKGDPKVPEASEANADVSNIDLEADLKSLREKITKHVQSVYSLLFEHLGLTDSEKAALSEFLVEVWMSGTRIPNYHPEPMAEQDRLDGIAAIIGDSKLERFLGLERNLRQYGEVEKIRSLLEQKGTPLSESQRGKLLEILVKVRGREEAVTNPNAQRGTIEALESRLAELDEYNRLVLELAPSVLSGEQVLYMFHHYQGLSYRRWSSFTTQERARSENPEGEHLPLHYPHD